MAHPICNSLVTQTGQARAHGLFPIYVHTVPNMITQTMNISWIYEYLVVGLAKPWLQHETKQGHVCKLKSGELITYS